MDPTLPNALSLRLDLFKPMDVTKRPIANAAGDGDRASVAFQVQILRRLYVARQLTSRSSKLETYDLDPLSSELKLLCYTYNARKSRIAPISARRWREISAPWPNRYAYAKQAPP